jgi:hypothetical protein
MGQQVGDAMGEGVGFAGTGTGNDEQRAAHFTGADAMGGGVPLGLVEAGKIGGAGGSI